MCNIITRQKKFTELYIKYKNYLFAICNRILNNEQDAEDALQDAFLKIYKNLDKLDHENISSNKSKSMIIAITRSTAIDFYRKNKRKISLEMKLEDYYAHWFGQVETHLELQDEELFIAISKLPMKYSECILLKYAYGYSSREISEILNITESNVRMRISRGKEKLFALLSNMNDNYENRL